jgi:diguanylate cyclase (GGDEF)-like protein
MAMKTAERLRDYVENNPFVMGLETFKLTISAGVANYSKESPDIESLLMQADKALYKAKSTGRNKVVSA